MNIFRGLSKSVAVLSAAAVLGATAALTGAVLSGPASAADIDTSSPAAFIRSVAPLAQQGQRAYRVPASVAIAQAILESGWGKSTLTTRGNAFFGIKCSKNMGPYATGCMNMRTREVYNGTPAYIVDGFRTYDEPVDSFKDHGRFLTVNSRYAKAFDYTDNPKRFIAEVHRAGYATDPTYTSMVVQLMDQHNLYRYDGLPASEPSKSTGPSAAKTVSAVAATTEAAPAAAEVPTATPSVTPSATPTATPSATPSATPQVPYASPSAVRTATVAPTASASETAALAQTAVPTATVSPTAIATETATVSRTASETPTPNATPTPVTAADTQQAALAPQSSPTRTTRISTGASVSTSTNPSRPAYRVTASAVPSRNVSAEASLTPAATVSVSAEPQREAALDPTTVRAQKLQDPAKTGALHPDGRKVMVHNVRPKIERSGGLAKTGS